MPTSKETPKRRSRSGREGAATTTVVRGKTAKPRRKRVGQYGQPTLLTPETEQRVLDVLRAGETLKTAARYIGLHPATLYNWQARGRREQDRIAALRSEGIEAAPDEIERPYFDFVDRVERAEASCSIVAVTVVRNKMRSKDEAIALRAATWWLERRRRADFARVDRLDVGVDVRAEIDLSITIEEQRERTATILDVLETSGATRAARKALP